MQREENHTVKGKDRKAAYSRRALQELDGWLAEFS